ncbi:MAG: aldo/keto reductase [Halobacteriaceae archaeon]
METRPLGDTGHGSSVVTLGAYALQYLTHEGANHLVELAVDRGVTHVDVAPTYGDAELKLGPKLNEHRDQLFLGCKTRERDYEAARAELDRSLARMGVEQIDLYQFHAVTHHDEIDRITAEDGALRAVREAQAEGLVDHVGLTSHGHPDVVADAMDRLDLSSVMFPFNYVLEGSEDPAHDFGRLVEKANRENVGVIGTKAFARGPWPDEAPRRDRPYGTWYRPVETQAEIQDCLDFALSRGVTTITNPGDPKLVTMVLNAGENHEAMSEDRQADLMARDRESPVPAPDV